MISLLLLPELSFYIFLSSSQVVSGALDRLQDGKDSVVFFDSAAKRWRYRLREELKVRLSVKCAFSLSCVSTLLLP